MELHKTHVPRTILLLLILAATPALAAPAVTRPASRPIVVGPLPLLFVDDAGVQQATGLTRTLHPAKRRDRPVLSPEKPWEGNRLYLYGSLHQDPATGLLRMWYMSSLAKKNSIYLLYATSADGLAWTRPSLKTFKYDGSTDNNILFPFESPSVILDHAEKDAAKRYKLLGGSAKYTAFHSADGLDWKKSSDAPVFAGGDTHTLAQDPVTGDYLLYHKRDSTIRGRTRRTVYLSRSSDFVTWSKPVRALAADAEDDANATGPDEHKQVYCMSVYPHAGGFVGLPSMFHITRIGERKPDRSGHDGTLDIQLATSADGETWQRSTPRIPIIPRGGPGTYDAGGILGVSSSLVQHEDQSWVYYTAMNATHGAGLADKCFTFGRAEWRRDGFASMDAGAKAGRLETKPLKLSGRKLLINADAARGQVRVGLLGADGTVIPGYAVSDCDVMSADATRWPVTWHKQGDLPADRLVRVVVEMAEAKLFSIASGE